jgi:hypothetical protein
MHAPADRMMRPQPCDRVFRFHAVASPGAGGPAGVLVTSDVLTSIDLDRLRKFIANEPKLIDGQTVRI